MSKRNYKKNEPIRLNAPAPKVRDWIHLGEIIHGKGGAHKDHTEYDRKKVRKEEREDV